MGLRQGLAESASPESIDDWADVGTQAAGAPVNGARARVTVGQLCLFSVSARSDRRRGWCGGSSWAQGQALCLGAPPCRRHRFPALACACCTSRALTGRRHTAQAAVRAPSERRRMARRAGAATAATAAARSTAHCPGQPGWPPCPAGWWSGRQPGRQPELRCCQAALRRRLRPTPARARPARARVAGSGTSAAAAASTVMCA